MKRNFWKKGGVNLYKLFTLRKRVITTILCICLTFMLAVPTFAASKITLKSGAAAPSSIYTGHSYSLKVAGTKVKFYTSNKKVATIGATTGKLKAVAPGTVKITAKSTKTGKAVATKTFKVLQRATSIAADVSELYLNVGETATINVTKTPATSTDVVRFSSADKTIATVGTTSGKVTAKAEGKCTIRIYSKATKATANNSKTNKVTNVEIYVGTHLKEAIQRSTTELDLVFHKAANVKSSDLVIMNDETKVSYPVKSVSIDKEDNKVAHVELFAELKDGKTYTVQCNKTSAQFTATDDRIDRLQIVPTEIACGKKQPIYVQMVDANGVILGNYTMSNAQEGSIEFESVEIKGGGRTENDSIVFDSIDASCEVKVCYHTYKYNNGQEEGKIELTQTIKAKPCEVTIDYTINDGERPDFKAESYKQNTQVCLEDSGLAVHFYLTDYTGEEMQDYSNYQIVAEKPDQLIIEGKLDNLNKKVLLKFSDTCIAGTTNIKVLDKAGNLIKTLPITIGEAREINTVTLSSGSLTLYKGQFGGTINVTAQDQYGKNISLCEEKYFDKIKIALRKKVVAQDEKAEPKISVIKNENKKVQIKVDMPSDEVATGSYAYALDVPYGKQSFTRRLIGIYIKDGTSNRTDFHLEGPIEIDLAYEYQEVNQGIALIGELCTNKTLKFTVESKIEGNSCPIPKIIQDEQGRFLLNLDLSGETVKAGDYVYEIKCVYESQGVSKEIKRSIVAKVTGEKPLESQSTKETLVVSQQPGVSLMAEGEGEVKADFIVTPQGTKVTLTAFPAQGYQLKEWKVLEGTAEIIDNSFILQNQSVTIQGVFEVISTQTP